ncbi:hypothetical protein [Staphylococcus shinii]|uniref:hypothetical protein n=1 Tax=Staphylococcus shinii TaxID=2912228 RepID=UPI003EE98D71
MKVILAHALAILCFLLAIKLTEDFIYLFLLYVISFCVNYKLIELWITHQAHKEIKTILTKRI